MDSNVRQKEKHFFFFHDNFSLFSFCRNIYLFWGLFCNVTLFVILFGAYFFSVFWLWFFADVSMVIFVFDVESFAREREGGREREKPNEDKRKLKPAKRKDLHIIIFI